MASRFAKYGQQVAKYGQRVARWRKRLHTAAKQHSNKPKKPTRHVANVVEVTSGELRGKRARQQSNETEFVTGAATRTCKSSELRGCRSPDMRRGEQSNKEGINVRQGKTTNAGTRNMQPTNLDGGRLRQNAAGVVRIRAKEL
eukprot:6193165-Pleurochrysis_carterae.AAC.1